MTYSRTRPLWIGLGALALVWVLAWAGFVLARSTRVLPQQVLDFVHTHSLQGHTAEERAATLQTLAHMEGMMESEDVQTIEANPELVDWKKQLSVVEKISEMSRNMRRNLGQAIGMGRGRRRGGPGQQ